MDKQQKIAIIILPIIAIVLLAGGIIWKQQQSTTAPSAFIDGTYEGVGQGYGGDIKVELTVSGGKIAKIELLDHSETPGLGDAAALKIIDAVIEAQSADVDTVSGATSSSNGTIEAIKVAIAQASGGGSFPDGIHEGVAQGYGGDIKVKVEVSNGKIVSIDIIEINDTPGLGDNAAKTVADSIIETQSFTVDVVSGATKSSEGLIAAVKNALGLGDTVDASVEPVEDATITLDLSSLEDGIYTGKAEGFKADIELSITIEGGKITKIDIISMGETPGLGDKAIEETIASVIASQNLNVDGVTGATVSSKATISAIVTALEGAAAPLTADASTDVKPDEDKKDTEQKPAEQKPAEQKPAEQKPAGQKPAEQKPAEQKPAEQKPAEQKPAEQKPAEQKPAEQKPVEQKPAGAGFKDGTYKITESTGFYGESITITLTVEGGNIKSVKIVPSEASEGKAPGAENSLKLLESKYISKQSALNPNVDAITKATETTKPLINVINKLVNQAK